MADPKRGERLKRVGTPKVGKRGLGRGLAEAARHDPSAVKRGRAMIEDRRSDGTPGRGLAKGRSTGKGIGYPRKRALSGRGDDLVRAKPRPGSTPGRGLARGTTKARKRPGGDEGQYATRKFPRSPKAGSSNTRKRLKAR
jgi:hypothetical protein